MDESSNNTSEQNDYLNNQEVQMQKESEIIDFFLSLPDEKTWPLRASKYLNLALRTQSKQNVRHSYIQDPEDANSVTHVQETTFGDNQAGILRIVSEFDTPTQKIKFVSFSVEEGVTTLLYPINHEGDSPTETELQESFPNASNIHILSENKDVIFISSLELEKNFTRLTNLGGFKNKEGANTTIYGTTSAIFPGGSDSTPVFRRVPTA